ncbi:hypothetical protein TBLA_0B03560 [Henningerozyma blattae CBS 6284]|uniref:Uncharacterized protein n=1 Tax=Henningerozyma blattae (strain ATCC 34711 / CBS 6284 / DSM 70876 / NBRC 10599 / NRRL Y-10934 / UCD 77-7) TaxID=1071380 RepID=I2GYJ4_HENB6|nr:hypothetical protein TBLA_0B03560 [Tetrapisispora blattae CBS 6284]CCH59196.1 hypothetical protein TBLA_0B03560 [Tetrapisispora blattae CBS 6284]
MIDILVILTCLFIVMSVLRRYSPFQKWMAQRIDNALHKSQLTTILYSPSLRLIPKNANPNDMNNIENFFISNNTSNLKSISESLRQLKEYSIKAHNANGTIFKRTRELSNDMINQLRELQYFSKITKINESIQSNGQMIDLLIESFLNDLVNVNLNSLNNDNKKFLYEQLNDICKNVGYAITPEYQLTKILNFEPDSLYINSDQYRVVEAVSHICRDWSQPFQNERTPIEEFVLNQLETLNFNNQVERNLVVMPGAGLGRLSHNIATKFPSVKVQSIEWSTLMYICNMAIYSTSHDLEIRPFAMHYSGQLSTSDQIRPYEIQTSSITKPNNLDVLLGDFRTYVPSTGVQNGKYETITVVTPFFIDTAENLFEYIETIESLRYHCKTVQWINVGPLKYGTRPLVQLNVEELEKLRKIRGWVDISQLVSTDYEELNGYLTDTKSLYQGYYGLLKFHSKLTNPGM